MFSTEAVPIYTPSPAMSESVYFPVVARTAVGYQVLFNFAHLIGENWYLSIVLICISLIMNNREQFCIGLRSPCIYFLTNCPYLLPIFLLVCSFSYWFYILEKLALFSAKLHKRYFQVCHLYYDFAYGGFESAGFFYVLCNQMYIFFYGCWICDIHMKGQSSSFQDHKITPFFKKYLHKVDSRLCLNYVSQCLPPTVVEMLPLYPSEAPGTVACTHRWYSFTSSANISWAPTMCQCGTGKLWSHEDW